MTTTRTIGTSAQSRSISEPKMNTALSPSKFFLPTFALLALTVTAVADEIGMARELGPATWARCAPHLSNPAAKAFELSHVRSNTMPLSPFAGAYEITYRPSSLPRCCWTPRSTWAGDRL